MNQKKLLIMLLALIIIVGIILFLSPGLNIFNQGFEINDVAFDLPNGFHMNDTKKNSVRINDGVHTIVIEELNDTNVKPFIDDYVEYLNESNSSAIFSNTTLNGIHADKVTSKSTGATHYWFEYNNKLYTIGTWGKYEKIDEVSNELVKSMHPAEK